MCNLFQLARLFEIAVLLTVHAYHSDIHSNQLFRMDEKEISALEEWIDPSIVDSMLSDTEQEPKEKQALKPPELKAEK